MILDVGCGKNPHGTINLDIEKNSSVNLIGSGEYLPLKDSSFDMVYSNHSLEHVNNPAKMLMEMLRVSKRLVFIIVPHRFSSGSKMRGHKSFFNQSWFRRFSDRNHIPCDVRFHFGLSHNFPLPFHVYLVVRIWKG